MSLYGPWGAPGVPWLSMETVNAFKKKTLQRDWQTKPQHHPKCSQNFLPCPENHEKHNETNILSSTTSKTHKIELRDLPCSPERYQREPKDISGDSKAPKRLARGHSKGAQSSPEGPQEWLGPAKSEPKVTLGPPRKGAWKCLGIGGHNSPKVSSHAGKTPTLENPPALRRSPIGHDPLPPQTPPSVKNRINLFGNSFGSCLRHSGYNVHRFKSASRHPPAPL
jgi:hypothetical protein